MTAEQFQAALEAQSGILTQIRAEAHALHASVNQTYDNLRPYGFHLDMVADGVRRYGHSICAQVDDVVPLLFGAYFHDAIEDARQNFDDILRLAYRKFGMTPPQGIMATEIVYALTNDKGRTRCERAGEHYYQGIRQTPYAPLVKLCDRLANATYSATHTNKANAHLRDLYRQEMPHFFRSITVPPGSDPRLLLPQEALDALAAVDL